MTAEAGSYRYMAPEVFRHEPYNEKCDVYSFAMICYYLLRLKPPFYHMNGIDAARSAALEYQRPSLSSWPLEPMLADVLRMGWAEAHTERPSFAVILEKVTAHHQQAYGCRVDESIAQQREQPQQRSVHMNSSSMCVVS